MLLAVFILWIRAILSWLTHQHPCLFDHLQPVPTAFSLTPPNVDLAMDPFREPIETRDEMTPFVKQAQTQEATSIHLVGCVPLSYPCSPCCIVSQLTAADLAISSLAPLFHASPHSHRLSFASLHNAPRRPILSDTLTQSPCRSTVVNPPGLLQD
jgi:hypothetical protein